MVSGLLSPFQSLAKKFNTQWAVHGLQNRTTCKLKPRQRLRENKSVGPAPASLSMILFAFECSSFIAGWLLEGFQIVRAHTFQRRDGGVARRVVAAGQWLYAVSLGEMVSKLLVLNILIRSHSLHRPKAPIEESQAGATAIWAKLWRAHWEMWFGVNSKLWFPKVLKVHLRSTPRRPWRRPCRPCRSPLQGLAPQRPRLALCDSSTSENREAEGRYGWKRREGSQRANEEIVPFSLSLRTCSKCRSSNGNEIHTESIFYVVLAKRLWRRCNSAQAEREATGLEDEKHFNNLVQIIGHFKIYHCIYCINTLIAFGDMSWKNQMSSVCRLWPHCAKDGSRKRNLVNFKLGTVWVWVWGINKSNLRNSSQCWNTERFTECAFEQESSNLNAQDFTRQGSITRSMLKQF